MNFITRNIIVLSTMPILHSLRFRLGIYVPEGLRGVAHIMGYKDDRGNVPVSREKLGRRPILYKHKYKNYKPFNPTEIKEKYLYANRKDKQKLTK